MQSDHPKPTRAQRLRRINWPFLLFLAALVVWLTGCGEARSTDPGPAIETVAPDSGPMIDVNSPRFVVQQNGQDMSDGHGGILQYRDPVVAGVILERLAVADPQSLYSIDQRGGHWGVSYDTSDPDGELLQPADIYVQQENSSGLAINAPLRAGPAVFQLSSSAHAGGRPVEWYLDGAPVGEGDSVTIDLEEGDHLLSVIVWNDGSDTSGGSQSIDLPLYVAPRLAQVQLQWSIPEARENGAELPVSELCCYQVTYITGNTLTLVDVDGGATDAVALQLPRGLYRFSVVAIDSEGLVSAPSDTVEADLSGGAHHMNLANNISGEGLEPPANLLANPFNHRQHPKWQRDALLAQMREVGWIQRVIVNTRTGHLIDGHLRVELALERDEPQVPVLYVDLDEHQEHLALATLDPISALAEQDQTMLDELLTGLPSYDDGDLEVLLDSLRSEELLDAEPEPDPSDDDVPRVPSQHVTQPGDLWLLGDHRLLCGDSTDPACLAALTDSQDVDMVWTDPPYNIDYTSADGLRIKNDDMGDGQFRQFLIDLFASAFTVTKPGGPIYVAHADSEGLNFRAALVESGWLSKQAIIWVKDGTDLGGSDYQWKHEPILYGWKPGAAHAWYGERNKKTVIDDEVDPRGLNKSELINEVRRLRNALGDSIVRENRTRHNKVHPTMKPVALVQHFLRNSSRPGDTVLDLCGGSGTTLVAAEKTRRQARLMELDPKYCDVICQRYIELTGKPVVLHGSGQSFADLTQTAGMKAAGAPAAGVPVHASEVHDRDAAPGGATP